ncbi:hypothetical protein BJF78_04870 [Pseudonocardia sp. CNS-139]|nr:hypothetical protein BJF78_04870 [Pseudonocardia sp. CNS-139]
MFTDFSQLVAQSELHRKELLADADNYRLARLAGALRHRSREEQEAPPPDDPPESAPASAHSNNHSDRRYAVSR